MSGTPGSFLYDRRFRPAGPALTMRFSYRSPLGGSAEAAARMLLDTGADASTVPESVIRRLAAGARHPLPYDLAVVLDYRDDPAQSRLYLLDAASPLLTGPHHFYLTPATEGLIGRDILNRHVIELDGPGMAWRVK